jgi:hypothetical protein
MQNAKENAQRSTLNAQRSIPEETLPHFVERWTLSVERWTLF